MLRVNALAIAVGDTPPNEFRIFAAGKNETSKGEFIFDEQAAREVMKAYETHGVDVMLDLEHLSLEDTAESRNYDPDARGWCKLQLRNGELWAVAVTWTPDGEARLKDKRQRYISPAFDADRKTRRILRIFNIAITAMPATHDLAPLVAANDRSELATSQGENMTPEQFAALAEALGLGTDANVEDVIATVGAMVKKIQDAANGTADPADKTEPAEVTPAAGTPEAAAANAPVVVAASRVRTAARVLARLSGKTDIGSVVTEIETWQKSHLELETQRTKLAQERATLEGGERRRLVGDLVKLGAENPATAWADDDATKPAEPWASMPIEKLRDRVAKLGKGKGAPPLRSVTPPASGDTGDGGQVVTVRGEAVSLSAHEIAACKDSGAKLEDYAENKLIRLRARAARSA